MNEKNFLSPLLNFLFSYCYFGVSICFVSNVLNIYNPYHFLSRLYRLLVYCISFLKHISVYQVFFFCLLNSSIFFYLYLQHIREMSVSSDVCADSIYLLVDSLISPDDTDTFSSTVKKGLTRYLISVEISFRIFIKTPLIIRLRF